MFDRSGYRLGEDHPAPLFLTKNGTGLKGTGLKGSGFKVVVYLTLDINTELQMQVFGCLEMVKGKIMALVVM